MGRFVTLGALVVLIAGCQQKAADATADTAGTTGSAAATRGVDVEKKIIRIGALNDESGPAAAIGKPYALGKRILS